MLVTAERVNDVVLDFGLDSMHASSHLLCLASPVFDRMLESGMKEAQQSIIKMEVASKEEFTVFYDLLRPTAWRDDKVTVANVESLLSLSDYYQVEAVKQACEQLLLRLPCTGTRLLQAHKHGLQMHECLGQAEHEGGLGGASLRAGHPLGGGPRKKGCLEPAHDDEERAHEYETGDPPLQALRGSASTILCAFDLSRGVQISSPCRGSISESLNARQQLQSLLDRVLQKLR